MREGAFSGKLDLFGIDVPLRILCESPAVKPLKLMNFEHMSEFTKFDMLLRVCTWDPL